jgi:hypothetical protein
LPDEDVFTIDVESPWELYFDGASHIEPSKWDNLLFLLSTERGMLKWWNRIWGPHLRNLIAYGDSTHFSTNQWYIWVALVLPDGEAAQIKIEEKWLLPAVLELIPEEYEVDYVSAMSVK